MSSFLAEFSRQPLYPVSARPGRKEFIGTRYNPVVQWDTVLSADTEVP
jgi:hypothetical protein